jgi:hypothetical protein
MECNRRFSINDLTKPSLMPTYASRERVYVTHLTGDIDDLNGRPSGNDGRQNLPAALGEDRRQVYS